MPDRTLVDRKALCAIAVGVLAAAVAFGQAGPKLEFEVASIRPWQPSGQDRVDAGLRMDGAQAYFTALSIKNYIAMAYHVEADRITGPDWIASERFDINAKLPDGATTAQVPEMMQSLLAARFGLKVHHETKDMPAYALVLGKSPVKLKELPPDPATPPAQPAAPVNVTASGSAAGVSIKLGNGSSATFSNDEFVFKKVTTDMLAAQLSRYSDRPIVNMTDLKGSYDLTLAVTPEDYRILLIRSAVNAGVALPPQALHLLDTGSPDSLFDALNQQGLRLDSRKLPMDLVVVDQVLRTPTPN